MFNLSEIPPCFCGMYYENTEQTPCCEVEEQSTGVSVLLDEMICKWLPTEHRKQFSIGDPGSSLQSLFVSKPCSSFFILPSLVTLLRNHALIRGKTVEWSAEVSYSSVNSGLKDILRNYLPPEHVYRLGTFVLNWKIQPLRSCGMSS